MPKILTWKIPTPFGKVTVDVSKLDNTVSISFMHPAFNKSITLEKNKLVEEVKKVLEWLNTQT